MTNMVFTQGVSCFLKGHETQIPDWQKNLIGELFSCVRTTEGRMMRLKEGEFIVWETGPINHLSRQNGILVVFPMAMGMGENGYMPSGEFLLHVGNEMVIEFCAVKYSTLWAQGQVKFYYEVKRKITVPETATAGLGYLLLPIEMGQKGKKLQLSIKNRKKEYTRSSRARFSNRWIRVDGHKDNLQDRVYTESGIEVIFGQKERPKWNNRILLFGDLHSHSGRLENLYMKGEREFLKDGIEINCGISTPENYYRYAKNVSRLDFFCLTDHHRGKFASQDWDYRIQTARRWASDEFVTLLGYEYIGRGHWNAYFKSDCPPYPPGEDHPIDEVKSILKKSGDVLFFPHQVPTYCGSPVDWSLLDAELAPLVEIYSHWGSGEYFGNPLQCRELDVNPKCFVDHALSRGLKLGFIASTDEHGGAPGDGITNYNPIGAGLACMWAEEFSREGIFESMRTRNCYGTTGARIILKFSVNGIPMGQEIQGGSHGVSRTVRVEVEAPEKIRELVLVKNGKEVAVENFRSASCCWEWKDPEVLNTSKVDFYYPRVVLEDGETAWGSPVWIG